MTDKHIHYNFKENHTRPFDPEPFAIATLVISAIGAIGGMIFYIDKIKERYENNKSKRRQFRSIVKRAIKRCELLQDDIKKFSEIWNFRIFQSKFHKTYSEWLLDYYDSQSLKRIINRISSTHIELINIETQLCDVEPDEESFIRIGYSIEKSTELINTLASIRNEQDVEELKYTLSKKLNEYLKELRKFVGFLHS